MSERVPWWKAFMVKKKSGPRETSVPQSPDQDQDPSAPQTGSTSAPNGPSDRAQDGPPPPGKAPLSADVNIFTDETYDDSVLEPVFNEQTCRRHMRVSRSGRFKEKRRVRSSLPAEEQEQEKGRGDLR